jgi:hypothetical protein
MSPSLELQYDLFAAPAYGRKDRGVCGDIAQVRHPNNPLPIPGGWAVFADPVVLPGGCMAQAKTRGRENVIACGGTKNEERMPWPIGCIQHKGSGVYPSGDDGARRQARYQARKGACVTAAVHLAPRVLVESRTQRWNPTISGKSAAAFARLHHRSGFPAVPQPYPSSANENLRLKGL